MTRTTPISSQDYPSLAGYPSYERPSRETTRRKAIPLATQFLSVGAVLLSAAPGLPARAGAGFELVGENRTAAVLLPEGVVAMKVAPIRSAYSWIGP